MNIETIRDDVKVFGQTIGKADSVRWSTSEVNTLVCANFTPKSDFFYEGHPIFDEEASYDLSINILTGQCFIDEVLIFGFNVEAS